MARTEADRDDLFAELLSCPLRAEWHCPSSDRLVTAGLRRDESVAIFFDGDPVYHFDPRGRLRRGFVGGALYRTQGTTLARLTRLRTPVETILQRVDLRPDEMEAFLAGMRRRISEFLADARCGSAVLRRLVPMDSKTAAEILSALDRVLPTSGLAPPIPTRRD